MYILDKGQEDLMQALSQSDYLCFYSNYFEFGYVHVYMKLSAAE